jgi:hypothetical protein
MSSGKAVLKGINPWQLANILFFYFQRAIVSRQPDENSNILGTLFLHHMQQDFRENSPDRKIQLRHRIITDFQLPLSCFPRLAKANLAHGLT